MKILVATNMFPTRERPYFGIFVHEQVESLRPLGCAIDVAAHLADASARPYWRGLWDLRRRLILGDYDLIHSHHTYSTLLAWTARLLAKPWLKGKRPPIIATFHEGEVLAPAIAARRPGGLRLKRLGLRLADRVIAVQRDLVPQTMQGRALKIPVAVIPMGIDLEKFAPRPRDEARRAIGWPERGLCLLFPSDPDRPEKGAELARAGFALWRQTLPEDERKRAWLAVGGGIDYARMPDAVCAADVVLLTSRYEASPTAVKEALACERPVVATDVGDVREAYADLNSVRICDANPESLARQIAEALNAGGSAGRDRIVQRGLGLTETARRVLEVYRDALQDRS